MICGLMIARDEEVCVGMTVDTVKDWIDALVFVDNCSKDNTEKIVEDKCKQYNIKLIKSSGPLSLSVHELRYHALELGKKTQSDWFFTCDGDMVFTDKFVDIRKLAQDAKYGQYKFITLNLSGDIQHRFIGEMNVPHMYLFKNIPNMMKEYGANYNLNEDIVPLDPTMDRFIGWNLNTVKSYEHIYWRTMVQAARYYNRDHGTTFSQHEYILHQYGKYPDTQYMKNFAFNRLCAACDPSLKEKNAKLFNLSVAEFEKKYMDYPSTLTIWKCPFDLIVDDQGYISGRTPDLINVKRVPSEMFSEIYYMEQEYLRNKQFMDNRRHSLWGK